MKGYMKFFREKLPFHIILTLLYAVLLVFAMYHHELWRDEVQSWLISAASKSPLDIFHNIRYEGHPPLWYLVMWPFTHLGSPEWIKVPHFLLAITSCYIISRYSPFPKPLTLLLVFGYFFFFEYGVISRNYQLGVLGIMSFTALFPVSVRKPWLGLLLLCLAMPANVFALILSVVLALFLLVESLQLRRKEKALSADIWPLAASFTIFFLFTGITIWLLMPPKNSFMEEWHLAWEAQRLTVIATQALQVFLPIPPDVVHFWNYSPLTGDAMPYVTLAFGILIVLLFARYPPYLLLLVVMSLGVIAFQYVKYTGMFRHSGHLWLAFVVVLWLITTRYGWQGVSKPLKRLFILLLLVHCYSNIVAVAKDFTYPFSGGKSTAQFVKESDYKDYRIVGFPDYAVSAFTAYYGKPVYYANSDTLGTYVEWSYSRRDLEPQQYFSEKEMFLRSRANTIIICNTRLDRYYPWLKLKYDSGKAVVEDERFYVFVMEPL